MHETIARDVQLQNSEQTEISNPGVLRKITLSNIRYIIWLIYDTVLAAEITGHRMKCDGYLSKLQARKRHMR
jgi:hypothetical protein